MTPPKPNRKINIKLTKKEVDALSQYILDASWLVSDSVHDPKLRDWVEFQERYKHGTKEGKLVDDLWAKLAHKIGVTDSCGDCKVKKPVKICPKLTFKP